MEKGILILMGAFVLVGVLHLVFIKTMKLSETKKTHFRKIFWYCYGILFMLSGGINQLEKETFHWSFSLQFIIGLVIVALSVLGKIETKTKQV
jgi:uncharacterized membrane protein